MGALTFLKKAFQPSARNVVIVDDSEDYNDGEIVIFGGIYEKHHDNPDALDTLAEPSDVRFDFCVPVNGKMVALPGITSNPQMIATLQSIPHGQAFRILKSSSWGPMGTRFEEIELVDTRLLNSPTPQVGHKGLIRSLKFWG